MTQNNEQKKKQVKIETELAYWLDSFDALLEIHEKPQTKIHSFIPQIYEYSLSPEQTQCLTNFLNEILALTFVMKDNKGAIQKFIDYHTKIDEEMLKHN